MKSVFAILVALFALPGALALVTDPIQNDAGTGHDAGDSAAEATLLGGAGSPKGAYVGMLVPIDDPQDWYAIDTPAAGTLQVSVNADPTSCAAVGGTSLPGVAIRANLYDPRGETRASATVTCGAPGKLAVQIDSPGLWRISLVASSPLPPAFGRHTSSAGQAIPPLGYGFNIECQPWC